MLTVGLNSVLKCGIFNLCLHEENDFNPYNKDGYLSDFNNLLMASLQALVVYTVIGAALICIHCLER